MDEVLNTNDPAQVLEDALQEGATQETPTEAPEAIASESETTPQGDGQSQAFTSRFDPNALSPELQQAYRQMQADYTRKTQELAEQRRGLESDPVAQAVKHVRELAQSNPVQLAQWLREQAQQAEAYATQQGYQVPQAQGVPEQVTTDGIDPELLTPTEKAIYEQIKRVEQSLQQYAPMIQETQLERGRTMLERTFMEIEQEVGRKLTPEDQNAIASFAVQMGVRTADGLKAAARAWDYPNASKRSQAAAAATQQAKQAMAVGGRPGGGGTAPVDVRDIIKSGGIRGLAEAISKGEIT